MYRSCRSNVFYFVVLTILLMRMEVVIAFFLSLLAAYLGKSSNLLSLCFFYVCVCQCLRIFVYVMRLCMLFIIFNKNLILKR